MKTRRNREEIGTNVKKTVHRVWFMGYMGHIKVGERYGPQVLMKALLGWCSYAVQSLMAF